MPGKPVRVDPPRDGWGHPPAGWHNSVCVAVLDLGFTDTAWGMREMVRFLFQLEARNPATGRRWILRKNMRKSLARHARLRRFLETWRARDLSPAELEVGLNLSSWEGCGAKLCVAVLPPRPGYEVPLAVIEEVLPLDPGVVVLVEDYKAIMWQQRRLTRGDHAGE